MFEKRAPLIPGSGLTRVRLCRRRPTTGGGRRHVAGGQLDPEGGADAGGGLHGDGAAGVTDDAVDGGEAEPGAPVVRLGAEERLENAVLDLWAHPGAGVG